LARRWHGEATANYTGFKDWMYNLCSACCGWNRKAAEHLQRRVVPHPGGHERNAPSTAGSVARAEEWLPVPTPSATPAPAATPTAPAANEPDNQKEQQRADRGVDDRRDDADAEMDAELGHQPIADERSYDSDDEITDDSEPGASYDLARQPPRDEAYNQYDEQTLARHVLLPTLQVQRWFYDPSLDRS
jgi:hypothetical protein